MFWRNWSIKVKITVVSVAVPLVLFTCLVTLWSRDYRNEVNESIESEAYSVVLAADGARQNMEALWSNGMFSPKVLRQWIDEGK
ncbi:MAG TPA: hypothetical protein PLQ13_11670, partial [Candidatus Krumholzibacteria bacterium]|nr:hypothetical protein [Candidatus Krumholzibacteria bacterium]